MFGWFKKNDGFEWREYVRTTILLKRKNRRDRVAAAKDQAVAGAKRAGQAGKEAGSKSAAALGAGLMASLRAFGRGAGRGLVWMGHAPRRAGAAALPLLSAAQWRLKPLARRIAESPVRTILRNLGLVALIVALAWLPGRGLVQETWIAGGVAALALGALLLARIIVGEPVLPTALADRLPGWRWIGDRIPDISPKVIGGTVAAVVVALAGGVAWHAWQTGGLPNPGLASLQLPGIGGGEKIEGRASAIDGDTLRIGSRTIQLAGIEAPDREQRCSRPGNTRWRCGDSAREALTRLIARHRVNCTVSGGTAGGVSSGVCMVEGADVGETLVRKGHVFAKPGLFATYGAAEVAARDGKAGLWRGAAERPQAWRDKLWAEAKRSAPDGCPIKGEVRSGSGKVYLLPWSPRYERAKIVASRGERWFCSESEARAAGWKAPERS